MTVCLQQTPRDSGQGFTLTSQAEGLWVGVSPSPTLSLLLPVSQEPPWELAVLRFLLRGSCS